MARRVQLTWLALLPSISHGREAPVGDKIQHKEQIADGQTSGDQGTSGVAVDDQSLLGNSAIAQRLGLAPKPQIAQKGLSLAAERMVDEMAARQELQSMFETGDVPVDGKAWVSPEEFDHIVETYSAIRRGETQLTIDGDEAFRAGAMKDIAKIMQTESGRAMLDEIAHSEHTTKIGGTNDPDHPVTSGRIPGVPLDTDGKWKIFKARTDGKTGVDSEISYSPGHTVKSDNDGEFQSDVTLFHELTHAWHNGKGNNYPGEHNGVDNDEYQAVWFDEYNENRYRAERAADLGEDIDERKTYDGQGRP